MAEKHRQSMHRELAELARLAGQRSAVERKASSKRRVEHSFRKLELDDALSDLKKKMGI